MDRLQTQVTSRGGLEPGNISSGTEEQRTALNTKGANEKPCAVTNWLCCQWRNLIGPIWVWQMDGSSSHFPSLKESPFIHVFSGFFFPCGHVKYVSRICETFHGASQVMHLNKWKDANGGKGFKRTRLNQFFYFESRRRTSSRPLKTDCEQLILLPLMNLWPAPALLWKHSSAAEKRKLTEEARWKDTRTLTGDNWDSFPLTLRDKWGERPNY